MYTFTLARNLADIPRSLLLLTIDIHLRKNESVIQNTPPVQVRLSSLASTATKVDSDGRDRGECRDSTPLVVVKRFLMQRTNYQESKAIREIILNITFAKQEFIDTHWAKKV